MASPSSSAQWHTISPHTRPLTLTVLELTPLALTLSLSLTPPLPTSNPIPHTPTQHLVHSSHHTHAHSPLHAKHQQQRKRSHAAGAGAGGGRNSRRSASTPGGPGEYNTDDEDLFEEGDHALIEGSTSFKDLLSHGVVVSVNGQPWSRIYAHVSEDDEDDSSVGGGEWEDEPSSAANGTGPGHQSQSQSQSSQAIIANTNGCYSESSTATEEGMEEGTMTRRRPRKARFGVSAAEARTDKDGVNGPAGPGAAGGTVGRRRKEKEREKMDRDRAVVVVYGLMPGKEYEVELRVVGLFGQDGGDGVVSSSVLIPPSPTPNSGLHARSRANSLRSRSRPRSRSNSLSSPSAHPHSGSSPLSHTRSSDAVVTLDSLPSISHDTLSPETAIVPTPILNAVDTQAAQLRHLIATAHAEKDHLQAQIKEARRTSQRQEAALKAEIEAVKKAIEKAGSMDLRAKQKALAVQEQVKQGWAGAESAEKEMGDVESGLDTLESRLEAMTIEVESFRDEWRLAKEREEEVRDRDRKARAEEDKKLAEVVGKIEKLKSKKSKREAETTELEKKLEDLERQKEEAEKRIEEEKATRRGTASYYAAGYGQQVQSQPHGPGHHDSHDLPYGGRSLSAHPSLTNLSGHYAAGPAYRPRGAPGGYQPRFASAGARPSPTQPSPTHPNAFYPLSHPVPPSSTSPAFRPPKLAANNPAGSRSASGGTSGGMGVNAAAMPFHPSNFAQSPPPIAPSATTSSATSSGYDPSGHHTTALMPPQLQHRIYLPNVRPRPTPNFHPPPSVMAEQQAKSAAAHPSSSTGSGSGGNSSPTPNEPAFPPLGGKVTGGSNQSSVNVPSGPSLASIVTRAVLSPTSALAQQSVSTPSSSTGTGIGVGKQGQGTITGSPITVSPPRSSASPTPPLPNEYSHFPRGKRSSFQSGSGNGDSFPPLSPTWGPLSPPGSGSAGVGLRREGTPPISSSWGKESTLSGMILKKGSGGGVGGEGN
nr:uncharacterized protein CI109_003829 [Kwoniella shandongensis]KAA5527857.1 hypothetical protein CI109_003829 [Kwoniella shandongensis]